MTEGGQCRELLARASTLALITHGRRSGRPHRVLLWFVYREGTVYLMVHARAHVRGTDWYRNARAHPTMTVEAGGRRWIGRAEPLPQAMLPTVMQWFAEKYGSSSHHQVPSVPSTRRAVAGAARSREHYGLIAMKSTSGYGLHEGRGRASAWKPAAHRAASDSSVSMK